MTLTQLISTTTKQGVGVIEISGKAAPALFQSKPSGYEPNNYLIEWTAVSHTRVFKFELLYRLDSILNKLVQISCDLCGCHSP